MTHGKDIDFALIDADILVYRSAFSAEHNIHTLTWEGGVQEFEYKRDLNRFIKDNDITEYEIDTRLEVEPVENALHTVKETISSIINAVKPGDIKLYLTKGENFRHKLATIAKYKGNRDNQKRPEHYASVRDYLIKYYNAEVCEGVEADDKLADEQTDRTVLCSVDKDLLQVPGKHYNWVTDKKKLVLPETGLRALWEQVLTGDKTDNIPGIYRCGPVTAKKWLADCTTEEEYRAVCVERWTEYLSSDNQPAWVDHYGAELVYTHWDSEVKEPVVTSIDKLVEEIYQLVKVGRR